jgi:hypothetical protein
VQTYHPLPALQTSLCTPQQLPKKSFYAKKFNVLRLFVPYFWKYLCGLLLKTHLPANTEEFHPYRDVKGCVGAS